MKREEIRRIRLKYGLAQVAFSRALGVSTQAVYYWERGTQSPSAYHEVLIHRLAAMTKRTTQFARAKAALEKTRFMQPEMGDKTSVQECGIGYLLFSLFGNEVIK